MGASTSDAGSLGRVVLFLSAPGRTGPPRDVPPLRLGDAGFEEALRVIGPVGSVVAENGGTIHHRLFWLEVGRRVDLELAPGARARIDLSDHRLLRVYCDLHVDEHASIFVAPSHHYALLDFDGDYAFDDVAAGEWTLAIWSDRVEGSIRRVEVEAGSVSREDVWIDPRRAELP